MKLRVSTWHRRMQWHPTELSEDSCAATARPKKEKNRDRSFKSESALGKLNAKKQTTTAQNANKLNKQQLSLVQKVKRWFSRVKPNLSLYFRTAYWQTRFTVWIVNKRTPAIMYDRLGVRYTTGLADKNYRTYVKYLRFYEYFKGPAENPLLKYGPKVATR